MIVVVGLSHKTAPIEVRERVALSRERLPEFLQALVARGGAREAFIVSTCNRVELVASGSDLAEVARSCVSALESAAPGIAPHLYVKSGAQAVRHLFRVAASLDSLVLGEPQILGQVKAGFDAGREARTVGSVLHRTVPRALRAAKRVRSETAIGSGQVSVPSVAVDLTRQIFGELRGRSVLLVGSGEMAEAVARLLRGAGARLFVLGRTRERVESLAASVGGEPRLWPALAQSLAEADVVITSTSAPHVVIDYELVLATRKKRRGRDQSYIDLAVPRDVDARANSVDGVFLYNIDDFSRLVAESLALRSREAELAEQIIEEETRDYERWADAEQATPTIVQLRALVRRTLEVELERSLRGRLKHLGASDRAALEIMLEAAENRLLHEPSVRLRQAAQEREPTGPSFDELSQSLAELFGLGPAEQRAPSSPRVAPSASESSNSQPEAGAPEHSVNARWQNSH